MRKLKTLDIFKALRAIQKAGIKQELAPMIAELAKLNNQKSDADAMVNVGIMGMITVAEAFAKKDSEQCLYDFLAGPFELQPEEVAEMELDCLSEHLRKLAEENDISNFFRSLHGLISMRS